MGRKLMGGLLRAALAAMLAAALALPAFAAGAESAASASTLRLEKTQGEVTITNAASRAITVREGGRLRSGYQVTTDIGGYAWLALDDDKLVKLDGDTQVTVKQNGKKYELMLEYGKIFFDVQEPLEQDETLDIRTSTLSTGVRGTMGIVESQPKLSDGGRSPERYASVELFEGEVELAFYSIKTGELETENIPAGALAQLVSVQPGEGEIPYLPLSQLLLTRRSALQALRENPFALVEFADSRLADRLVAAGGLTRGELDGLLAEAGGLMEEMEEQAVQERQEQQAAHDAEKPENPLTDPVFEPGQERPDPTPRPTAEPTPTPRPAATLRPALTPAPTPAPAPTQAPSGGETGPAPTPTPVSKSTVSFRYNGGDFASATVVNGQPCPQPMLQPTARGSWQLNGANYDFSAPVTGDITLVWQES